MRLQEIYLFLFTLPFLFLQTGIGQNLIPSPPNYKIIITVAAIFSVLFSLGLLWNYQLRRLNRRLSEKQEKLLKLSEELQNDIYKRRKIEKQLLENEQQLTGIISNLPGFVYRCQFDGQYTMQYISQGCKDVTGYEPEAFLDNRQISFASIILPEEKEQIKKLWEKALESKGHFEREYRILTKDSSTKWIWERGHGVFSGEGKLLFLEGFISDITQQKKAAQALLDSEKRYRLITENASDVIWTLSISHNCYTYVSPSVKQLRGLTVEKALAESPSDSMDQESYQKFQRIIASEVQAFANQPGKTGKPIITEIQQPHKEGHFIRVEISIRMQIKRDGDMEVIGVSRNIEERKRMEDAIEYKNQMHRLVAAVSKEFVSANIGNINSKLARTLQQAGEFFHLDRAYVFHYSEDKKFYRLTHEWCADDIPPSYEINEEIAFSDFPWWDRQIQKSEPIYLPDIDLLPADATLEKEEFKRQGIKSVVCFPVITNGTVTGLFGFDAVKSKVNFSSGQLLTMQLITHNISDTLERINAEEALAKSEEASRENAARYKAFIAASNAGAWEFNYETGNLWCSPNYFSMLGRDSKDFDLEAPDNAMTIWEQLMHPEDREEALKHLHVFMENQEGTYERTFRLIDANGQDFWVLSRGKLLIDNPELKRPVIIGTHMDINNQKRAEEVIKNKNKELETFLYVTSHDLRSPLINIQGFSHKVEKQIEHIKSLLPMTSGDTQSPSSLHEILNHALPRNLEFIYSNVDQMNNLINGLLTISRVGRVKLDITECNMNKLVSHIYLNLGIQIEQTNATIHIGNLPNCFGDENLLNQLFTNLVDNALKYKKADTPVCVSIEGKKEKTTVQYTISDNGMGISKKHLPKIWDVFFRANGAGQQKGEGIGLSLAKIIVEKHRGHIGVESTEGEGTTFMVQLPAETFTA
ncbi:MAG: PAS domain-containing protein [bacterium]